MRTPVGSMTGPGQFHPPSLVGGGDRCYPERVDVAVVVAFASGKEPRWCRLGRICHSAPAGCGEKNATP
jgi:hypothetical protein